MVKCLGLQNFQCWSDNRYISGDHFPRINLNDSIHLKLPIANIANRKISFVFIMRNNKSSTYTKKYVGNSDYFKIKSLISIFILRKKVSNERVMNNIDDKFQTKNVLKILPFIAFLGFKRFLIK